MRYLPVLLLASLICAITPSLAVPTTTYIAADGTMYTITPGASGGECTPVTGGMECSGIDGSSSAYETGCGEVSGGTFCLLGFFASFDLPGQGNTVYATSTLECSDKNYKLSTGNDEGVCSANDGEWMTCTDGEAGNKASASCDDGCQLTVGSGSCEVQAKP